MEGLLFQYEVVISRKKGGKVDRKIILLDLCKEMGWSWEELQNTPVEIVDLAIGKINLERKVQNNQAKNG